MSANSVLVVTAVAAATLFVVTVIVNVIRYQNLTQLMERCKADQGHVIPMKDLPDQPYQ